MAEPLLEVKDLKVHFPIYRGFPIPHQVGAVKAVDGISFSVRCGETVGLVVRASLRLGLIAHAQQALFRDEDAQIGKIGCVAGRRHEEQRDAVDAQPGFPCDREMRHERRHRAGRHDPHHTRARREGERVQGVVEVRVGEQDRLDGQPVDRLDQPVGLVAGIDDEGAIAVLAPDDPAVLLERLPNR